MKTFEIFEHPILPVKAVKLGFSWPAFFLIWLWALWKELWLLACIYIVIVILLNSLFPPVIGVVGFIASIVMGIVGNEHLRESLKDKGYRSEGYVEANNPEAAIAIFIRDKAQDVS